MNIFDDRSRTALSLVVAAAMLAGCGGSEPPIGAPGAMPWSPLTPHARKHSRAFTYTGYEQYFTVPESVTHLRIAVDGATGGLIGGSYSNRSGGLGGRVKATIPVTPGETLAIFVGGAGGRTYPLLGGYNGGGDGGYTISGCYDCGYGGGGASDIRQGGDALSDRVIVAGGGGGGGLFSTGGNGGGKTGQTGANGGNASGAAMGGGGGSQKSGGSAGRGAGGSCPGDSGTSGALGQGVIGGKPCYFQGGGGGGGGYYCGGGGGGAGGSSSKSWSGPGGGGGGSSYVEKRGTDTKDVQGVAAPGDGKIIVTWRAR
ncbi:MAG TPA: glycine-rich protein [Candidatus Tumulicola sp.]|jgi:hypothetical protein